MDSRKKTVKKLSKVGQGIAVFLSLEAKRLGWKQGEYVSVEVLEGGKEPQIVLRKIQV